MGNTLSAIFGVIPPFLLGQAKYMYEFEDNIEVLRKSIEELEAWRQDVLSDVESQKRDGLQPLQEVQVWLSRVQVLIPQVHLRLEDFEVKIERLCMSGFCFNNYQFTYSDAKVACEEIKKVTSLLSSKPVVVARRVIPPLIETKPIRHTIGLEDILEMIWKNIMKENVGILGLYGMGGVGKSTLLDQLDHNFLTKTKDEFYVIFVVVSRDLQIGRIQNEIGKRLGIINVEWEKKNTREKASSIYNVLTRKIFVVLLDDLWSKVDIGEIGIPSPNPENRSKVVFTTRLREVCGSMKSDVEMEVTCLGHENAWKLFAHNVRLTTLESNPEIPELARKVCEKCKGLPLALNVIGETMASKTSVREWKHAIKVLDSDFPVYSRAQENILENLKRSYDDLNNERVKQCFQYCALFPKDVWIPKEALINYWICKDAINNGGDREEDVNEGYEIISTLINASMLMTIESEDKVRIHDVTRKMALWNASHFGEYKEVKTDDGLREILEAGDWNALTRMSYLKNGKVMQCLEYCVLFPENFQLWKHELVDYWKCEGFINSDADRKKGYEMISTLHHLGLLIKSVEREEEVIMPESIRQKALSIATEEREEKFVVKTGARLSVMPEIEDRNAVTRMSLVSNEIEDISVTVGYSNLKTLILRNNKLKNISSEFFMSIPKLVVLDLYGNGDLKQLPEEISNLVSLQYLGLSRTKLEKLPAGIRKLIQLRHLDLSHVWTCRELSVISSLVNLETLNLFESTFLSLVLIEVLMSLRYLQILSVTIKDSNVMEHISSNLKLGSCIRDISLMGIETTSVSLVAFKDTLRTLLIRNCVINDIIWEETGHPRTIKDFKHMESVILMSVTGMKDLTWLLFAPRLIDLVVTGPSMELKEIISREKVYGIANEGLNRRLFEKTRKIDLRDLAKLESIFWEPLEFTDLENFTLLRCPKMKMVPLNKESAKKNNCRLFGTSEWLDNVEWEDEAIKRRFLSIAT